MRRPTFCEAAATCSASRSSVMVRISTASKPSSFARANRCSYDRSRGSMEIRIAFFGEPPGARFAGWAAAAVPCVIEWAASAAAAVVGARRKSRRGAGMGGFYRAPRGPRRGRRLLHYSRMTAPSHPHAAVVEATGHLIDSGLLNTIFDTVISHEGSFEVQRFDIGRTNDDESRLEMRVSARDETTLERLLEALLPLGCTPTEQRDALLREADMDGAVPEDFYSTTNHRTAVRVNGRWLEVEKQRMDAIIVVEDGRAMCRKLRDVRRGDLVVCGTDGVRVSPEFQERDRQHFAFMANDISSERRVEASVARIATMMRETRRRGERIVFVAGPVVVHTGGAP